MNKSILLAATLASTSLAKTSIAEESRREKKPNFIVILFDDLGYGDLGVYGHPNISTPNLDKMAAEGQKWTSFYTASSVCTPSRAGLLTGRLPIRSGMTRVLFPNDTIGLPPEEITIAEGLKNKGYRTAAIGKWHLGSKPSFLPMAQGFESYYGIPYSNDMEKVEQGSHITLAEQERYQAYNVPLLVNDKVMERPVDQRTITKRYTEEAVSKIKNFKKDPFFLYLAYSLPHVPLFRSEAFKESSAAGIYGDVVEEIDWSVGQILKTLQEQGLDKNTLVVFTSDNGPWHIFKTHGGSAGLLQGAKSGTFEGGFRVPAIFWWPGTIKPNVVREIGATLDLLPTFCNLAGTKLPNDRVFDGYDISPILLGKGKGQRDVVFYYRGEQVYAIRKGNFKAHFITQLCNPSDKTSLFITIPELEIKKTPTILETPLLFNLMTDPSEKYNIASEHPEIISEMQQIPEEHKADVIKKVILK
jgi:arylsulfatase A-like enzyme